MKIERLDLTAIASAAHSAGVPAVRASLRLFSGGGRADAATSGVIAWEIQWEIQAKQCPGGTLC